MRCDPFDSTTFFCKGNATHKCQIELERVEYNFNT